MRARAFADSVLPEGENVMTTRAPSPADKTDTFMMTKETKAGSEDAMLLLLPMACSAVVLGVGAVFALAFRWDLVVFYLSILPFPLFLLWLGRDVPSVDAVIAANDLARKRQAPRRSGS
jgi:hypothetical protein